MGGYANRTIRQEFPELSADPEHDMIFVVIRNPRIMPPGELIRSESGNLEAVAAQLGDVDDDDTEAVEAASAKVSARTSLDASHEIMSKLIVSWNVYDGMLVDDNSPPLGLPATPELVAKLPLEIMTWLGSQLALVNPQKRTEVQEAGTSSPS